MNFHNQDLKTVLEIQLHPNEFKNLYQLLQLEKQSNSFQWHTRQLSPDDQQKLHQLKAHAQQAINDWQRQSMGNNYHEEEE
jgi:hypothetical protein